MFFSAKHLLCLVFLAAFNVSTISSLQAEPLTIKLPDSVASKTKALNFQFLLFPPVEAESGTKSPLLIFLHGGGAERLPIEWFKQSLVASQVRKRELPLTVVIPQRIENPKVENGWQPDDLNLLLKFLIENHEIDPDRVYLTGMSMGGSGTWVWADHSPQHFAAIVPVAAGGRLGAEEPLDVKPQSYKTLPVWAFHGNQDEVCPHPQIEKLVAKIKALDGPARLTLYDGVGHFNITERVYQDDALYKWLMKQSRSPR